MGIIKNKLIKKKDISLKDTLIVILVLSVITTGALFYTTFKTFTAFESLSSATDKFIKLQETANLLLQASDYLTEESQCYAVSGDRRHLENYITESEVYKNREKAIETMEEVLPDSDALRDLNKAMEKSIKLMDKEYHSMRLVLSAYSDPDIPKAVEQITLTPEENRMSSIDKLTLARNLVHNDDYYDQKNLIYADLEECVTSLKDENYVVQKKYESKLREVLVWTCALIILESLLLITLFVFTIKLGIKPLLSAVNNIKKDEKIPIEGAREFKYLAKTYNQMYEAAKDNIQKLSFKASHDELTGLYNRSGFDYIVTQMHPENIAFILVDTDNFKEVNDTYGHDMGDKVLKKIATVLLNNFRPEDHIFRIGGDEFVVLMSNPNNAENIIRGKVEQINAALSDDSDGIARISISVGIAFYSKNDTYEELYCKADEALYRVKGNGRHGCEFY